MRKYVFKRIMLMFLLLLGMSLLALALNLPASVVDDVRLWEGELGNGHKGVPLLEQSLQNGGQGLWRVEGVIVEENNGSGLDLGGNSFGNLRSGNLFPVQTIPIRNSFKTLKAMAYYTFQRTSAVSPASRISRINCAATAFFSSSSSEAKVNFGGRREGWTAWVARISSKA